MFGGGLTADVAVFFERLVDDFFEPRRDVGINAHRRNGRTIQNGVMQDTPWWFR